MDGCPKTLMISYDTKEAGNADFTDALTNYIRDFYQENADSYSSEISQINHIRKLLATVARGNQGCSQLRKYFTQLHYLQSRFPMGEGGAAAVLFTWYDVYSGEPVSYKDILYEQACVLFNLGGLYSQLGSNEIRSTEESMKIACTYFQCSAGAFKHLRENFSLDSLSDMNKDILKLKEIIMLGQAQECLLEKSIKDSKKHILIARISIQVKEYFEEAVKLLGGKETQEMGSSVRKSWVKHLQIKILMYTAVANMYMANDSHDEERFGEEVGFLKVASDKIAEALKASKGQPDQVIETTKFIMDVIGNKVEGAVKDNDFVYHQSVPVPEKLPEIKGASLVKAMPFSYNDPSVQDIFQRLIPMRAHEASSMYSEEKAKLLRTISTEIEGKDSSLSEALASMHIDELVNPEEEKLPENLAEKMKTFKADDGGLEKVDKSITELTEISSKLKLLMDNIKSGLDDANEDEESEAEISEEAAKLLKDVQQCREAHDKAEKTKLEVMKHYESHRPMLKFLRGPPSDVLASLPSQNVIDAHADEPVVQRIRELLGKVEKMKSQRTFLLSELREQLNKDDITEELIVRDNGNTEEFFQEQLKKHDDQCAIIRQNLTAQENILSALTEANAKYAPTRQAAQDVALQRNSKVQNYISSLVLYDEMVERMRQGMQFYKSLEVTLLKLAQRVETYCDTTQKERKKSEKTKATPATRVPPARPTAAKPTFRVDKVIPVCPGPLPVNMMPPYGSQNASQFPAGGDMPMSIRSNDTPPGSTASTFLTAMQKPQSPLQQYTPHQGDMPRPVSMQVPHSPAFSRQTQAQFDGLSNNLPQHASLRSNEMGSGFPQQNVPHTTPQDLLSKDLLPKLYPEHGLLRSQTGQTIGGPSRQPHLQLGMQRPQQGHSQQGQPEQVQLHQGLPQRCLAPGGISQQLWSQQGLRQLGVPQQGLPQHSLSNHGIFQQGISQQGLNQQGIPAGTQSQQGMLQFRMPQSGLSGHGMLQQGLSQQVTPQRPLSQQNLPHQGIIPQAHSQPQRSLEQGPRQSGLSQQNLPQESIHQLQQNVSHEGLPQHRISQQGLPQYGLSLQGPPSQRLPQQGLPKQALPQQGPPQQGPPQQGPPQQGLPQQGLPQQGLPQQGLPQQGPTQQGPPQQGPPQQGLPQQGLPPQGLPQKVQPQQGLPQRPPMQGLPFPRLPLQRPQQQAPPQHGLPQQGLSQQGLPQQGPLQQGPLQQGLPQQGLPQQGPQQQGPLQQGPLQQGLLQHRLPQPGLSKQGLSQQGLAQQGQAMQLIPQQGLPKPSVSHGATIQPGVPQIGTVQRGLPQHSIPQQVPPSHLQQGSQQQGLPQSVIRQQCTAQPGPQQDIFQPRLATQTFSQDSSYQVPTQHGTPSPGFVQHPLQQEFPRRETTHPGFSQQNTPWESSPGAYQTGTQSVTQSINPAQPSLYKSTSAQVSLDRPPFTQESVFGPPGNIINTVKQLAPPLIPENVNQQLEDAQRKRGAPDAFSQAKRDVNFQDLTNNEQVGVYSARFSQEGNLSGSDASQTGQIRSEQKEKKQVCRNSQQPVYLNYSQLQEVNTIPQNLGQFNASGLQSYCSGPGLSSQGANIGSAFPCMQRTEEGAPFGNQNVSATTGQSIHTFESPGSPRKSFDFESSRGNLDAVLQSKRRASNEAQDKPVQLPSGECSGMDDGGENRIKRSTTFQQQPRLEQSAQQYHLERQPEETFDISPSDLTATNIHLPERVPGSAGEPTERFSSTDDSLLPDKLNIIQPSYAPNAPIRQESLLPNKHYQARKPGHLNFVVTQEGNSVMSDRVQYLPKDIDRDYANAEIKESSKNLTQPLNPLPYQRVTSFPGQCSTSDVAPYPDTMRGPLPTAPLGPGPPPDAPSTSYYEVRSPMNPSRLQNNLALLTNQVYNPITLSTGPLMSATLDPVVSAILGQSKFNLNTSTLGTSSATSASHDMSQYNLQQIQFQQVLLQQQHLISLLQTQQSQQTRQLSNETHQIEKLQAQIDDQQKLIQKLVNTQHSSNTVDKIPESECNAVEKTEQTTKEEMGPTPIGGYSAKGACSFSTIPKSMSVTNPEELTASSNVDSGGTKADLCEPGETSMTESETARLRTNSKALKEEILESFDSLDLILQTNHETKGSNDDNTSGSKLIVSTPQAHELPFYEPMLDKEHNDRLKHSAANPADNATSVSNITDLTEAPTPSRVKKSSSCEQQPEKLSDGEHSKGNVSNKENVKWTDAKNDELDSSGYSMTPDRCNLRLDANNISARKPVEPDTASVDSSSSVAKSPVEDTDEEVKTPPFNRQLGRESFYLPDDTSKAWLKYLADLDKAVEILHTTCMDMCKKMPGTNVDGFARMWNDLSQIEDLDSSSYTCEAGRLNLNQNRYRDILPWDHSRVKLTGMENDYINASHIENLTQFSPPYIASQGPIPQCFEAFWTMVWEQQCTVIAMLTSEVEGSKLKCHPYWPRKLDSNVNYGRMSVCVTKQEFYPQWKNRIMLLTNLESNETRIIRHLQFTAWPDYGVPSTPYDILAFVEEVYRASLKGDSKTKGPILTHCSAGVGRTGTFCCIYSAIAEINGGNGLIDIPGVVRKLRQCRLHMVQRKEQLVFSYQAILCYAQQFLAGEQLKREKEENSQTLAADSKSPGPSSKSHDQLKEENVCDKKDQNDTNEIDDGQVDSEVIVFKVGTASKSITSDTNTTTEINPESKGVDVSCLRVKESFKEHQPSAVTKELEGGVDVSASNLPNCDKRYETGSCSKGSDNDILLVDINPEEPSSQSTVLNSTVKAFELEHSTHTVPSTESRTPRSQLETSDIKTDSPPLVTDAGERPECLESVNLSVATNDTAVTENDKTDNHPKFKISSGIFTTARSPPVSPKPDKDCDLPEAVIDAVIHHDAEAREQVQDNIAGDSTSPYAPEVDQDPPSNKEK